MADEATGTALHYVCSKYQYKIKEIYVNLNILKFLINNGGNLYAKASGFLSRFGDYSDRLGKSPLQFLY